MASRGLELDGPAGPPESGPLGKRPDARHGDCAEARWEASGQRQPGLRRDRPLGPSFRGVAGHARLARVGAASPPAASLPGVLLSSEMAFSPDGGQLVAIYRRFALGAADVTGATSGARALAATTAARRRAGPPTPGFNGSSFGTFGPRRSLTSWRLCPRIPAAAGPCSAPTGNGWSFRPGRNRWASGR